MIAVEDSGVGIGAEDLPRVGDPFFQARASYDRRHDGTGLGLSIVKGLVALHGGRFAIESRLGEGTRVVFHLPVNCEAPGRGSAAVERLVPRTDQAVAQPTVDISVKKDLPVKKSA
jgi:cell cycle sensor histidine kinase DivJ